MDLEDAAALVGGHRWIEQRLFVVLGSWVPDVDHVPAKLLLDRHAQHCAWRAAQWWDRLPVLAGVDRDELTAPPDTTTAALLDALAATVGVVGRVVGAYRVALPRLVSVYRAHRQMIDQVSDAPTSRTLDLVTPDLVADWHDGEVMCQTVLETAAHIDEAADTLRRLERLLVP